jgi:D-lactate dehydrogenase
VVRREISRLKGSDPTSPRLAELEADYRYAAVETCAADGMCATACPVEIDTGALVKRLRRESHSPTAQGIAVGLAERFALVERCGRAALRAGHLAGRLLGTEAVTAATRALPGLPRWDASMPRPAARPPRTSRSGARAVYVPSCVSRVLGPAPGDPAAGILEVLPAVAAGAGVPLWIPEDVDGHCCGMPFSSKGYDDAYVRAADRLVRAMWRWSERGRRPVVIDSSPCAYTLRQCAPDLEPASRALLDEMAILDGIEFAHRHVLPGLRLDGRERSVVLHPVCSVEKMGLRATLAEVAAAAASEVTIPFAAGCCGFAGDRGFRVPRLTEAATRAEAAEVRSRTWDGCYSSSRTCEIGLSRATGMPYRSFWYLLAEAAGIGVDAR